MLPSLEITGNGNITLAGWRVHLSVTLDLTIQNKGILFHHFTVYLSVYHITPAASGCLMSATLLMNSWGLIGLLSASFVLFSPVFLVYSCFSSFSLVFTESAHWANSVIESQCPCVCMSVSPPSEIYFRAFLPPLMKILGPIFFWIF